MDTDSLKKARELSDKIEELCREVDDILEPICTEVMQRNNIEEMKNLVKFIPKGFYRSELSVAIRKKEIMG